MASVNSMLVLKFLKDNYGKEFCKQDIAAKLGISLPAVTGTINALTKKGYVVETRKELIVDAPATETRKEKSHEVKYHALTEAGLTYDPVQEEADRAAAKEAEKARKAAERAAAKMALAD